MFECEVMGDEFYIEYDMKGFVGSNAWHYAVAAVFDTPPFEAESFECSEIGHEVARRCQRGPRACLRHGAGAVRSCFEAGRRHSLNASQW